MTTETLDKMYLEYSNITKAKTAKELKLKSALQQIFNKLALPHQLDHDALLGECHKCTALIRECTDIRGIS